jgi:hypothetical protein
VAIRGRAASVVREGCSLLSDGMHDWGYIYDTRDALNDEHRRG